MGHIAKESKTGYTVWYKQYIESECKCWGDVCKYQIIKVEVTVGRISDNGNGYDTQVTVKACGPLVFILL